MSVRILRAADRQPQPWKNGGGVTREVLVHPPRAGFDDFDWRVSIADVAGDGPFSRFDGVDRVMTILSGTLDLTFGAGDPVRLSAANAPYAFAGDAACEGRVVQAPVRDLNVMVRRGSATARVARLTSGRSPAGARLLLFTAPGTLDDAGSLHRLDAFDAVLVTGDASLTLASAGAVLAVSVA